METERMKRRLTAVFAVAALLGNAWGAPTLDESMQRAAADYRQKAEVAAKELNDTRARIAGEKAPLLKELRAAEDRIVAAEGEKAKLEAQRDNSADERRKLIQELESIRRVTDYAATLAHDSLKLDLAALAPGEDQRLADQEDTLQSQLDAAAAAGTSGASAMDAADFLLRRTEESLGGYRSDGRAMVADTRQVVKGTFAFVGPATFFMPAEGGAAGAVRPNEGARYPTSYPLANWSAADAGAFFSGRPGLYLADASGGKALRLDETRGTAWQQVQKGGLVSIAIIIVGIIAAVMILQKMRQLARMGVDSPATVAAFLDLVAKGDRAGAESAVRNLRLSTRELFSVGLRYADQPKAILEERLQAVLLEQRLNFERRLPLLAVIATASPLMGLLGTVVGMVKTFALISVFGTGNAGKLSGGISEVLIATELGLAVAIPTLVAHGFLAQRIHRNLSVLERYALQFTTAVGAAQLAAGAGRGQTPP
jgi:biopolymer transport protein ExbB